jgi:hypothetical protein
MSEKESSKAWDRLEARLQGDKPKVNGFLCLTDSVSYRLIRLQVAKPKQHSQMR